MLKKYFVQMIGFVVIGSIFFSALAQAKGDMRLTLDDGREVFLHENNTWSFVRSMSTSIDEDIYITLNDDRIIALTMDNKWAFVKSIPKVKQVRTYPEVVAVGKAKQPSLDQAVKAAREDAINRAASNLKTYASKSLKDSQKIIAACINREIGEHGAEIVYNPGWTAEAKVTLTPLMVRKVIECLEDQVAPPLEEEKKEESEE